MTPIAGQQGAPHITQHLDEVTPEYVVDTLFAASFSSWCLLRRSRLNTPCNPSSSSTSW
jgi:hypothetical protein